jgi:hypothetical protein
MAAMTGDASPFVSNPVERFINIIASIKKERSLFF